jgi:hypothetical protein
VLNAGKSLNTYVRWNEVLALLGIHAQATALPTTVSCPHCSHDLYIYQDITNGGAWHYCPSCNFAGDTIELAASVWKQDIQTTILKLNARGITFPDDALDPRTIDKYIHTYVSYRKILLNLWLLARDQLPVYDTQAVTKLHERFTAGYSPNAVTWHKRGKKFLGGCHVDDVLRAFKHERASNIPREKHHRLLNAGHDRVFKGRGWDAVLLIPFYDLPGRIKGFLFVGRDGDISQDIVFRRASNQATKLRVGTDAASYDPGLSMYDTMLEYHPRYKNKTFVLTEPLTALHIQLRHMKQSNQPLPLVGSFTDGHLVNRWLWSTVFPRDFIFWGPRLTPELVQQARHANGRIAVSKSLAKLSENPNKMKPMQWLDLMDRMARTWQQVLEDEIRQASIPAAESLLLKLRLTNSEIMEFASGCKQDVLEKLEDLFEISRRNFHSVVVDDKTIIETDDGWCLENGSPVSDTTICLEQVIHHPNKKKAFYRGHVTRNGQRVSFTEDAETVENNIGKWLRALLIPAGMGRPKISGKWQKQLLTIAQSFHEPSNVVGIDTFGWNEGRQAFVFPHFMVGRTGSISHDPLVRVSDESCPGVALRAPRRLTDQEVATLSAGGPADVFWAVTANVAANIIAPMLNLPPTGIGLLGTGCHVMSKAAAHALGCVDEPIRSGPVSATLTRLYAANDAHGWPFVLRRAQQMDPRRNRAFRAWLADTDAKNCITSVDWYQAQGLMINGGWNVIDYQRPQVSMRSIADAGQFVLPAFLQHVCAQRLNISKEHGLVLGILSELSKWFEGQGGDSLLGVGSLIHVAEIGVAVDVKEYFFNIIYQLLSDRKLTFVMAGFNDDEEHDNQVVQHAEHIYLPQRAILTALNKKGVPGLDISALAQELDTQPVGDQAYWMVTEKEWFASIRARKPGAISDVI